LPRGETTRLGWRDLPRGKVVAWALASFAPVLLVFAVATFPGEWLYASLPSVRFVPTKWSASDWTSMGWTSPQELLVGRPGDVDLVARKPTSVLSNRLVLPGIDVIEHAKSDTEASSAALAETLSLRGRRLEGAVLIDARLRKADFTAAQLQEADLTRADLRGAKFECAQSSLQESRCAQLQGATLDNAQLQGARLRRAQLQGAGLVDAQLQGAMLGDAQLQGASLADAQLQGAWLDQAQLQGARLDDAHLQGASLLSANLQGATLDYTQLQGARLDGAQLQGAELSNIFAWRADVRKGLTKGADVSAPETRPKEGSVYCRTGQPGPCDWSADSFAALKRLIKEQVPGDKVRHDALERIAPLDPARPLDSEDAMAKAWADLAQSSYSFDVDVYEESLAVSLRKTGCDANGAPYVIRGLLWRLDFRIPYPRQCALAAAFLNARDCPGARGLSEEDKLRLRGIRRLCPTAPPGASPSPPKN
jgi:uncharacterized protein YjbI with pentapeptide repeats